MDALAGHRLTGFVVKDGSKFAFSASYHSLSKRSTFWIPFPSKKLGSGYDVILQRQAIRPPSCSFLSAPSVAVLPFLVIIVTACLFLMQADKLISDSHVEKAADPRKLVRVRFVLQKECSFGQQFFVVGNNPMFGQWDPENAIPLEWSDGHVWMAELDLLVGRQIQFKFILKGLSGEIYWQPGRDRFLQPWETTNTIVVSEDWDNAEYQKITEEEPQLLILVEEAQSTKINTGSHGGAVIDQTWIGDAQGNEMVLNNEKVSESSDHGENLTDYEEGLLLVPGLAPIFASGSISGSSEEIMAATAGDASYISDEAEHCNSLQLSGEEEKPQGSCGNLLQEETMTLLQQSNGDEHEEIQNNDGDDHKQMQSNDGMLTEDEILPKEHNSEPTASVLQNDIQWGQRTLKQFLLNLGF